MNAIYHAVPHGVWGVLIGGLLGYAYYRFVGCSTGACPLTSNAYVSTLYGAAIGFLSTIH